MTDIVERLRETANRGMDISGIHCEIEREAADEIERLRAMLMKIAEHPNTSELIKQYAAGKL